MSEPPYQHPLLFNLPGTFGTNFDQAPPALYSGSLSDDIFPLDMDMSTIDWTTLINDVSAAGDTLPPIGDDLHLDAPISLSNAPSISPNVGQPLLGDVAQCNASPHSSKPLDTTDSQHIASEGANGSSSGGYPSLPTSDASTPSHIPENGGNSLSGGNYTIGREPDVEGPENDVPVGTVRQRARVGKEEAARKKVTTLVNRQRKQIADEAAADIKARWDQERVEFNEKHGFSPDYAHPIFGLGGTIKGTRTASASNALNSRASIYFNQGRAPGERLGMPAVMAMMKMDPTWSTKAKDLDEEEQEELRAELAHKREESATALRPTRLSGSKTADILVKRIDGDLHRLEAQTDSMFFMMSTKRSHDSAVKTAITGSEDVYDFFLSMYKLDPYTILKDFQLYALKRKLDQVSGDSIDKLRALIVNLVRSSMAIVLKPGQQIPMSYTNFQVNILEKYYIKIIGWPAGVPFIKPADIGSVDDLRKIVAAFKTGAAYWRPLTAHEKRVVMDDVKKRKEMGVSAIKPRAKRSDCGITRGPQENPKRKKSTPSGKENAPARKRVRVEDKGEGTASNGIFKSRSTIDTDEDEDEEQVGDSGDGDGEADDDE
ncbi:hypothetical protein HWV62_19293 [Athelia sp. TMB]|nr:hypothetical protein HWV62_19293 [Athelia sp. TMB]